MSRIDNLCRRLGLSYQELLAHAFALLVVTTNHEMDGGEIVFREADGKEEVVKITPPSTVKEDSRP
jgi:hypothetical protein